MLGVKTKTNQQIQYPISAWSAPTRLELRSPNSSAAIIMSKSSTFPFFPTPGPPPPVTSSMSTCYDSKTVRRSQG